MSAGTKDVYNRLRDFIAAAAKELVEREVEANGHELAYHQGDDAELSATKQAEYKAALTEAAGEGRDGKIILAL